jgi:hypothetical protein
MVALHDHLLRGKKMVVTAAAEQSFHPDDVRLAALGGAGGRSTGGKRTSRDDAVRPTTISLIKGQGVAGA